MKLVKLLALCCGLAMVFAIGTPKDTDAGYYGYPSYRYHYNYGYHYRPYYYTPSHYHYCIHYPRQRYVYYYNPYQRTYWGRFDLQGQPGQQYSLLAEEDRKGSLKDIPEDAFPAPGAMPQVPGTDDTLAVPPTPPQNAPADANQ